MARPPLLHDTLLYILIVVLGLLLVLFGVRIARIVSSVIVAIIAAYLSFTWSLRVFDSIVAALLVSFIALVIGGLLGFLLLRIGIAVVGGALVTDYLASLYRLDTVLALLVFLLVSSLVFILSRYLLMLGLVAVGGYMMWYGLTRLGLDMVVAAVLSIAVSLAGLYHQLRER